MPDYVTTLKALIRQRHMTYEGFCYDWDRVAEKVDVRLVGRYPARAQYYRWLKGDLRNGRPYPDACKMLEAMFPGWRVEVLFAPYDASVSLQRAPTASPASQPKEGPYLDLAGVYGSRAQFLSAVPLEALIAGASTVRTSGLSLNLFTQHYADTQMRRLVESGTRFRLLFLNPESEAMRLREREEGYSQGFLASLTDINIKIALNRVRDQLDPTLRDRMKIAISDEIVRFNIILVDQERGVVQPYLPGARGVDSPTFVLDAANADDGMFRTFDQVFAALWDRARLL